MVFTTINVAAYFLVSIQHHWLFNDLNSKRLGCGNISSRQLIWLKWPKTTDFIESTMKVGKIARWYLFHLKASRCRLPSLRCHGPVTPLTDVSLIMTNEADLLLYLSKLWSKIKQETPEINQTSSAPPLIASVHGYLRDKFDNIDNNSNDVELASDSDEESDIDNDLDVIAKPLHKACLWKKKVTNWYRLCPCRYYCWTSTFINPWHPHKRTTGSN